MDTVMNQSARVTPFQYSAASRILDAADQSRLLSNWSLHYDQLSRGTFEGYLREAWVERVQLFKEQLSQAVFQTGQARSGTLCLGVFDGLSGEARWQGETIGEGHVMCLWRDNELQVSTPLSSTLLSVSIPLDYLDDPLPGQPVFSRHDPELAQALRDRINVAILALAERPLQFSKPESRRFFFSELEGFVVRYLSGPVPPESFSRTKARQVVRKAQKYALERMAEPITVGDLCAHTHTSRRTLQACFEQVVGTSPAAFLKVARLNGVHHQLQLGLGRRSIADVAAEWGFWHLSQFAADYRRLFGELPSATARRVTQRTSGPVKFASF